MQSSLKNLALYSGVSVLTMTGLTALAQTTQEFTVHNRSEVVSNSVSGPGSNSSFLDTGTHLFHESEIYRAAILANGWNSTLSAALRYTDSTQFDPDKFSVQKFEYRLNDASKSITLGDYFANLSQYSMNKAIKGMGYQQNFGDDQNYLRATYGTFDGQWAYLLRDDRADEPMNRQGGGLRYQRQIGPLTYGVNLAFVSDSADDGKRRPGESAYEQTLPSFDWEYRTDALTLAGEHAYSSTTEKAASGNSVDTSGMANKLTLRAMAGPANLDANLEQVGTDFMSLAGGATPDRFRAYVKADAKVTKLWKVFGSVDYYHNDLTGQLAYRTSNTSYEMGLTKRRAFDRKTLTLSTSLRQRVTDTDGKGSDQTTDRIKLKANDTFGVIDVRGDIERIVDGSTTRTGDTMYNIGLSSRIERSQWTLVPNFEFGKGERDNVAGGIDVTSIARISLQADRGNGTAFGLNYDNNIASTPVQGTDAHVSRLAAYFEIRPALRRGSTLKFELANNDYQFGNASTNYSEQIARIILTWPLDLISK